jgi:hypothetical protein
MKAKRKVLHHASGKDTEGTAIYAGKRQKLLQLINSTNKATNNARTNICSKSV